MSVKEGFVKPAVSAIVAKYVSKTEDQEACIKMLKDRVAHDIMHVTYYMQDEHMDPAAIALVDASLQLLFTRLFKEGDPCPLRK